MSEMKRFWLVRTEDVSGVAGLGVVAFGIRIASGQCILIWDSLYTSITIFQDISTLEAVHSHNGATKVVWTKPKNVKRVKGALA